MKQIDEHRFQAEEGKTFVHKTSGIRMGNRMYLAESDSVDNYHEEDMTEEEIALEEEQKDKEAEK